MVRKVTALLAAIVLLCATGTTALAASHSVYDGSISATYVQYWRDIISGKGIREHYVGFRSGQYEYTLVVGVMSYNGTTIHLETGETAKMYVITAESGYNSGQKYEVEEITEFSLNPNQNIIYTDMGEYPQLEDRGQKYEIITAMLLCIGMCSIVVNRIFFRRPR